MFVHVQQYQMSVVISEQSNNIYKWLHVQSLKGLATVAYLLWRLQTSIKAYLLYSFAMILKKFILATIW